MSTSLDPEMNRKIIVDTDMGLDDCWALLIFIWAEKLQKVKIEAIVCTPGNTNVINVCRNVVRMLELVNRTDIPVYASPDRIITEPRKGYYGNDGFGDLEDLTKPDLSIVQEKSAAEAVCDIVSQYPEEVSYISLAPLTSLANALKTKENLKDQIKDVWIMGGNDPDNPNYPPTAEFNFCCDLEAADLVLKTFTCPVYILPFEACLDMKIPLKWRYNLTHSAPVLDILTKAEKKIYAEHNEIEFLAADAVMAHVYLDLFKNVLKSEINCVEIEMEDPKKKGQMKIFTDPDEKIDPKIILREIDVDYYKDLLIQIAKNY